MVGVLSSGLVGDAGLLDLVARIVHYDQLVRPPDPYSWNQIVPVRRVL